MVEERNIAVYLILTLVTCGIFGLYWFVVLTDDVEKANNSTQLNGALSLVLTIVTCGIYGIYWSYKIGKEAYEAGQKANVNISDNSVVYLILSLFGFSIITWCLVQNDLNTIARNSSAATSAE